MDEPDVEKLAEDNANSNVKLLAADCTVADLAELLTAMANGDGGTLLLELGALTLEDASDRVYEAALRIEPTLILPLPVLSPSGQGLLLVTVPQGLPHVFALDGRYLHRDGNETRPLLPREIRRLLIERGEHSYEEEIRRDATLNDLDWQAVEAYAVRMHGAGASAHALLAQRGCIVERGNARPPTKAGLLLVGTDPQRYIRGAFITAARFASAEMSDTFSRHEIVGNLPQQILQAETFLLDNLRRGVQLGTSMERTEYLEYPMEAVRELVVNAVSHRDYSIQGDGIRMFLFGNRLEVSSPGGLPGPVTIDNIADERFSRNSIIVQVLSDLGFIERLGYGVDRAIALMQDRGLPTPQFEETAGGFRARLFNAADAGTHSRPRNYSAYLLNPRQAASLFSLTH